MFEENEELAWNDLADIKKAFQDIHPIFFEDPMRLFEEICLHLQSIFWPDRVQARENEIGALSGLREKNKIFFERSVIRVYEYFMGGGGISEYKKNRLCKRFEEMRQKNYLVSFREFYQFESMLNAYITSAQELLHKREYLNFQQGYTIFIGKYYPLVGDILERTKHISTEEIIYMAILEQLSQL